MNKFIVMSANYEMGRYGHDKIKNQTIDAHAQGKLSKFVITNLDLIDSDEPPTTDNFRFEPCQAEAADVVVYVDKNRKSTTLKGADLENA